MNKSNCCLAPVQVGGNTTHYYVCSRCNRACDLASADSGEKSYVTLVACPICNGETGELLLDRRLRPRFSMHTIIPYSVCANCRKTYLKKGVMLINPDTGSLVVLKTAAFKKMFKKTIPETKIIYCEEGVLDRINEMNKEHQDK